MEGHDPNIDTNITAYNIIYINLFMKLRYRQKSLYTVTTPAHKGLHCRSFTIEFHSLYIDELCQAIDSELIIVSKKKENLKGSAKRKHRNLSHHWYANIHGDTGMSGRTATGNKDRSR